MKIKFKFEIAGYGIGLPSKKVFSEEIERDLNLSKGWINENVGVKSRYRVSENENNTSIGSTALENALVNAQIDVSKLDYLISGSSSFDMILPNRSSLIKKQIKGGNNHTFPCVDIDTTCLSFVSALEYAAMLLHCQNLKYIAIVSSEISSHGLNPEWPETYSLFGDAAAAFILKKTDKEKGLIFSEMDHYSEGALWTKIDAGGNSMHPKQTPYSPDLFSFNMQGKKLLYFASKKLPDFIAKIFEKNNLDPKVINKVIPHQASKHGLTLFKRIFPNKNAEIVDEIEEYGNCIAASIPLALANAIENKQVKEGDTCLLFGTAAGLSIGGLLFTY